MKINGLALISSAETDRSYHYLSYHLLFEKCIYAEKYSHFDDSEGVKGYCISYKIESFVLDESQIGSLIKWHFRRRRATKLYLSHCKLRFTIQSLRNKQTSGS